MKLTPDQQDSVNATVEQLGLHGAMTYAVKRLPQEQEPRIRRMMIHIIRFTTTRLTHEVKIAKRLADAHTSGLRQLGFRV